MTDALQYVESRERGEEVRLPPVEVSLISTRGDKGGKAAKSTKEKPATAPAKTKTPKKKT